MEELITIIEGTGFKVIPLIEEVTDEYARKWGRDLDIKEFIQSGLFIGKKAE